MEDERIGHERERPGLHVARYAARVEDLSLTAADLYIALENLVASQLEIDEVAAAKLLSASEIGGMIAGLHQLGPDDATRIETELYKMAPLVILWPILREIQDVREARIWLEEATELALSEVEFHDDENCSPSQVTAAEEYSCNLSPLCPSKTVAGMFLSRLLRRPEVGEFSVDPKRGLYIIRQELSMACRYELTTENQGKMMLSTYLRQRYPQPAIERPSPEGEGENG